MRENSSYYLLGYYSTNNQRRRESASKRDQGRSRRCAGGPPDQLSRAASQGRPCWVRRSLANAERSARTGEQPRRSVAAACKQPTAGEHHAAARRPPRRSRHRPAHRLVSVVVEIPVSTLKPTDEGGTPASRVRLSIGFYNRDGAFRWRRRSDDRRVTCPWRNIPLRIEHSGASRSVPAMGRRRGNAQPRERKRDDRHRSARFQSSDALAQRHHGIDWRAARLLAAIFLPTTSSRCAGSCTIGDVAMVPSSLRLL